MSYSKKLKKRSDIVDVFYTYGKSDNFEKFKGNKSWRLSKKVEFFSNDTYFEADGELKNETYFNKHYGTSKRLWRFDEDLIGAKK